MRKKILVISSDHTGHGHKSIAESLSEKIGMDKTVELHIVDGFALGGKLLLGIGKSYGPITRFSEQLWKVIWHFSAFNSFLVDRFIESMIKHKLLNLLDQLKPDLILSIHPNFNGSVINILEKQNISIPFVTLIADLVNIYPLWADPRADFIISPTEEAKEKCLEFGVPDERIKVTGFPVRQRFYRETIRSFRKDDGLNFLIMSGGEGVGNMNLIAENLLSNFDCSVTIVAGRNEKLKEQLESSLLSRFGDRVEILGFVKNIQDYMFAADVAITRGSPNVMFEAIASNLPIVITGALPGQEKDNPLFAQNNNLGIICKDAGHINLVVEDLLANDGEKLNGVIKSQMEFVNKNAANDILKFLGQIETKEYYVPVKKLSIAYVANRLKRSI
ncbi:MAG: glycosyltransferase [Bacillota bacterium]|jgi:processive 1,2-diacylglycerol beta-glucosyltransferase|nr:glycosyltransferase [Bacillota bacterium]MDP4154515.1 glycosyltransferase [Bacillota bacterium]